MLQRLKVMLHAIRERFSGSSANTAAAAADAVKAGAARAVSGIVGRRGALIALGVTGAVGYAIYNHPPMQNAGPGEAGIRINQLTGSVDEWRDGSMFVMPGLHKVRLISLHDETYRPEQIRRADGGAPVQSVEGLSFGIDLSVRYAVDAAALGANWKNLNGNTRNNASESSANKKQHDVKNPLVTRCTYGLVWVGSVTLNREGNALALAVQPMDAWRELWVFRKEGAAWTISVLPPATTNPELGYAEFAGWVPGGKQMLVAREARGEGKYKRNFELVRLDTLTTERQAGDPSIFGPFQRWQDPAWKRNTLSLR